MWCCDVIEVISFDCWISDRCDFVNFMWFIFLIKYGKWVLWYWWYFFEGRNLVVYVWIVSESWIYGKFGRE